MKTEQGRKRRRRRKCRCCGHLYMPDARRARVQKYCDKPECRKASQARSWHQWFMKPGNRDYYKGKDEVDRVRQWRAKHPGYWKRGTKPENALPKIRDVQVTEDQVDTTILATDALPKMIMSEPALAVGLIASLTGSALPKDIEETSRRFVTLGQDILGINPGISPKGGRRDGRKESSGSRSAEASAQSVQLG